MVKDPVCGMEVDPKTTAGKSDYQGQTYYFCSMECKKAFDKNRISTSRPRDVALNIVGNNLFTCECFQEPLMEKSEVLVLCHIGRMTFDTSSLAFKKDTPDCAVADSDQLIRLAQIYPQKGCYMKRIVYRIYLLVLVAVALLIAFPMSVRADGGGEAITQTVDGYQVTLVLEKPFVIGENSLHLVIHGPDEKPVSDALVEVAVVEGKDEHVEEEAEADHDAPDLDPTDADTLEKDSHDMNEPEATVAPADEHEEMKMIIFAAGHEAGEYQGDISVAGTGEWALRVHLTVEDRLIEFNFPFHVDGAQTGSNILLGYLAVNAVILGAAAVFKFKLVGV
jgi:YHS domain-containing protein